MFERLRLAQEPSSAAAIGYVLKGYPRLSELFIASEIHRLEQSGLRLRLFVIKRGDEALRHPLVDRIHAQPEYLPPTTSVSAVPLRRWLRDHLPVVLAGTEARQRPASNRPRTRRRRRARSGRACSPHVLVAAAQGVREGVPPGCRPDGSPS